MVRAAWLSFTGSIVAKLWFSRPIVEIESSGMQRAKRAESVIHGSWKQQNPALKVGNFLKRGASIVQNSNTTAS